MSSEDMPNNEDIAKKENLSFIGQLSSLFAHDVRNSLNIIKNSKEIIEIKGKDNLDAESKKQLEIMGRTIDRITHQVDDVLNFVRAKPLVFRNYDLLDLLNSAIRDLNKPKGITINLPSNTATLYCDGKQLEIVFYNLINNAIQALGETGSIDINAQVQNNDVLIDFVDSGPGIPENNLSKLFEPLFTTKPTGTGLGLVSCKRTIEKHGGDIKVKNNPTTFSITLKNEKH